MSAAVDIIGLTKTFDGVPAVENLSLSLDAGSLTAVLGPSGCGKTTTLRMLAGLLQPDAGDIRIDGASVLSLRPESRPIGMVFQRPLLFPHLDVAGNVGFGLRMRSVPRRQRAGRVEELLTLVGLPGYGGRAVGSLSGGQQQRVALARALAFSPGVLLLDEPFSQLDPPLRADMRRLLRSVQEHVGVTTVFVTHDQQEAVELADSIALLLDGRLEQHGAPRAFYEQPATPAAALFFGAENLLPGFVRDGTFTGPFGALRVSSGVDDGPAVLVVRPEVLRLGDAGGTALQGRVTSAAYRGTHLDVTVTVGDVGLVVRVPPSASVPVGDTMSVDILPGACTVLPARDGASPPSR